MASTGSSHSGEREGQMSRVKSREILRQVKARMKADVELELFIDGDEFQLLQSKPFGEDGPLVFKIADKSKAEE